MVDQFRAQRPIHVSHGGRGVRLLQRANYLVHVVVSERGAVEPPEHLADRSVLNGQDGRALQVEDQEHVGGPLPDAAHRRERRANLVVGEPGEGPQPLLGASSSQAPAAWRPCVPRRRRSVSPSGREGEHSLACDLASAEPAQPARYRPSRPSSKASALSRSAPRARKPLP